MRSKPDEPRHPRTRDELLTDVRRRGRHLRTRRRVLLGSPVVVVLTLAVVVPLLWAEDGSRNVPVEVGTTAATVTSTSVPRDETTTSSSTPESSTTTASPPDEDTRDPNGGDSHPGVARQDTPWGLAAMELVVDDDEVSVGERVSFQLVNRGEVELLTGLSFEIERWDGETWVAVPPPENTAWPAAGIILQPGGRTNPQSWPMDDTNPEPGQYRVVKSATAEDPEGRHPDVVLVARTTFRVVE